MIPPFSSIKLFETKNFLKNSRIPLRKFSALWDIKISTKNRDKPPLIHKFFSIRKNFRKTEGFLYKAFRFGPVRQKFSTKPWCPATLLCMKFFDKRIFLKHQSVLQWNISVQWGKNFDGKSWNPPPSYPWNIFPYQKFFETQNGSLAKFFRSCEIKKIRQNLEASPLLCLKLFDTRILSKHRRVLLRILSALRDKDISTEFSDIPFLCIKFCDARNFLKHRSVP